MKEKQNKFEAELLDKINSQEIEIKRLHDIIIGLSSKYENTPESRRKFNKHNFLLRIFVSPLIFCILFITHNLFVLRRFYHFLKFGGEYVNFEENERRTLMEIYNELKKKNESKKS